MRRSRASKGSTNRDSRSGGYFFEKYLKENDNNQMAVETM